jgi:hypothetical protein
MHYTDNTLDIYKLCLCVVVVYSSRRRRRYCRCYHRSPLPLAGLLAHLDECCGLLDSLLPVRDIVDRVSGETGLRGIAVYRLVLLKPLREEAERTLSNTGQERE